MPAYVIADVTVTDPATMEEYRKQVPATIAKYGAATSCAAAPTRPSRASGSRAGSSFSSFPAWPTRAAGTTARSTAARRRSA
jgi:Domain of unknown function (DUF1330)